MDSVADISSFAETQFLFTVPDVFGACTTRATVFGFSADG